MGKGDDFFRETTLRISSSLQIDTAAASLYAYYRTVFPIVGLSLSVRDEELGAIRRLALAADHEADFPAAIVPLPVDLWTQVRSMARREPQVITAGENELFRRLGDLFQLGDRADLVLPLWLDDTLRGALSLRGAAGARFTRRHLDLVATVARPLSLALAGALARERVERYGELLLEDRHLSPDGPASLAEAEIIGRDGGLANVLTLVRQVAPLANTVLLLGETGTGKELVANAIHFSSTYRDGPFVKVNCGAIPEHLIDSELFGHERGAFTGAVGEKRGRFERANRGTIFLDEIGELPPQAQIRLLRVLQNREIERVGGSRAVPVDIRVIAATHRNLESMVRDGRFREDLWFRLNVFPIMIPPLRQRTEDIPALALHFIARKAREIGIKDRPAIAPGALARLRNYHWPGNVRELENLVERELILHRDGMLTFASLMPADSRSVTPSEDCTGSLRLDDRVAVHITRVLALTGGRINGPGGAAELLGIKPNTLRARMDRLGVSYGRRRTRPAADDRGGER